MKQYFCVALTLGQVKQPKGQKDSNYFAMTVVCIAREEKTLYKFSSTFKARFFRWFRKGGSM